MKHIIIASIRALPFVYFRNPLIILFFFGLTSGCTYQVDSYLDLPDSTPGNFACATDRGSCTLRAAIMEASANATDDTILIPAGTYTLDRPFSADGSGGHLAVSNSVTLQGEGAGTTIINQTVSDVVLEISDGEVQLNNLTIQGGNAQNGAGIFIGNGDPVVSITDATIQDNSAFTSGGGLSVSDDSDVTLRRVTVRNNSAVGAFGGGLRNRGTLWVYESAITANQSNRAGGIHNSGNLNLRNVTVSGNSATSPNAGVGGIAQIGFAVLNNVTVTNNTGVGNDPAAARGGGIQTTAGALSVVKNSIIAGNNGGSGPDDCVGSLTGDSKYNLIGNTEGCDIPSFLSTYILDQPANLSFLTSNGGPTQNHATLSSSLAREAAYSFPPPAIDACESHDQRGVPRPQGAGNCDMGAYEFTTFPQFITGYMLVSADTSTDIRPLLHGDTLDLDTLPSNLSVRAVTVTTPGSVVFDFDGNVSFQIENVPPYALDGDSDGVFNPVDFTAGEHTIRSTPFQLPGGNGAAGGSRTIIFDVIE